jgi:hypothetical protein
MKKRRRGRPSSPDPRRVVLGVRLTEAEAGAIEYLARLHGMPAADLVRLWIQDGIAEVSATDALQVARRGRPRAPG